MKYWQHETPLKCPKQHRMTWLGAAFWICGKCRTIYVQHETRLAKKGATSVRQSGAFLIKPPAQPENK